MKVLIAVCLLFMLSTVAVMAGKPNKFTFNDVTFPDATTGEIEATSKDQPFTTCRYYAPGYVEYLGRFDSDQFGSADGNAVLQFCLDNYEDRTLD